jgi:RHS repeat-associated protein
LSNLAAQKNGYLLVYVSNESNFTVYFDNLQIVHKPGPIVEETHYYPFGVTMNGISSKGLNGLVENKIKFQNQEFASKEFSDGSGLDIYEFKWRMHDPQIGRFWQVDPLSEKYFYNSTYAFSENKVIAHRELEGLEAENINSKFKKPGELSVKVPDPNRAQIQFYDLVVRNSSKSFSEFKYDFKNSPQSILSNSMASFHSPVDGEGNPAKFEKGSFIKIYIDGPANDGYVKVTKVAESEKSTSASFVTMEGHVEKGVINFTLADMGEGKIRFTIGSMSQVDQELAKMFEGTARNAQKASWNEVLSNVVKYLGGEEQSRNVITKDPNNK